MRVEYSKWDGRAHWHFDVDTLGEDEHGLWLAVPKGRPLQRGSEPPIPALGFAVLVPISGWWIAHFYVAGAGETVVYVNVTDQPKRLPRAVTAIDLDLDVIGWLDGRVEIDDEDEFREHAALFSYPADVVSAAEATAHDLAAAVKSGVEPFGAASRRWTGLVGAART